MLWLALSSIATMREQQPGTLPRMLWIDTPPQVRMCVEEDLCRVVCA